MAAANTAAEPVPGVPASLSCIQRSRARSGDDTWLKAAEPGGLHYEELRAALFALAEHTDVIGFDLVEVNPMLDVGTGVTSYLAAHTIVEFLARICAQPRWAARTQA
jgi:hypothetical protein